MEWLRRLGRRFRILARRAAPERSMDDEMRQHIECETEERIRSGETPEVARREALVAFGGLERWKEEGRDARGGRLVEDVVRDVRYALRLLRRNPGFTVSAVLTFALGIGAATAIASVIEGVLLRPLPYVEPERLVALWERNLARGKDRNVVAVANFEAWRDRSRAFVGIAALVPSPMTLSLGPHPEHVVGAQVSPGYFRLLGVAPALGREFTDSEGEGGGARVVVLSDGFFRSRLGGDPSAIGRTLLLDGSPHAIVGVMPADFEPPRYGWMGEQPFWLPFAATEENRSWGRFLHVVARLRPGVSEGEADAEMDAIGRQLAREVAMDEGWSAAVVPLARQITGDVREPLLVLFGAVGLLFLMAVTNVALLTLALTRRRERELAVRRALGASPSRLFRQLFTQSALVGVAGCAAGLGISAFGVRFLVRLLPPDIPRAASIRVDWTVLLCGIGAAALATTVFGTAAARRGLRCGGNRVPVPAEGPWDRSATGVGGSSLVTAEIALALVLSILAGLMVRSFIRLRAVDLGFTAEKVVTGRVALDGNHYADPESQRRFFEALLERARALPGVRSASLVNVRPLRAGAPRTSVADAARPLAPGVAPPVADIRFVDASLFETLRIRLVAGSLFDSRDAPGGPLRAVVDQATARALWPSEAAVGRRLTIALSGGLNAEVLGVVGDTRLVDPRTPPRATVYLSASPFPSRIADVVVRGDGGAEALAAALRDAVAGLDPAVPVYDVAPLQGLVDAALARDRFVTLLLGAFSVVSLLLTGVGIFGLFSADVTRRRREIGIRLALGARPHGVLRLVLRRALTRTALGVAVGIPAALLLTRFMASLLFGIGAADPVSFMSVTALLFGVALLATLIPAIQAARVSPLVAIRSD